MKWLLLLAFVAVIHVAVGGLGDALFEPAADDFECLMCGDPVLRTFDRQYHVMTKIGKTRLIKTAWAKFPHVCKFEVDCVIQESYYTHAAIGRKFVDWCGVAFWETKDGQGFFRNWMIGQSPNIFGERGVGFTPWKCRKVDNTFPKAGEKKIIRRKQAPWKKAVPRVKPNCGGVRKIAYIIRKNVAKKRLEIRSYCCGWAVDWYPDGRDTCINIFMKKDNPQVKKTTGMCGNANGNGKDDWVECITKKPCIQYDPACTAAMEKSCQIEDVTAMGYPGATKLHRAGMCADPGLPATWLWGAPFPPQQG